MYEFQLKITIFLMYFLLLFLQTADGCPAGVQCSATVMSWEGSADIQSGDVLIVEIDDTLLISSAKSNKSKDEG